MPRDTCGKVKKVYLIFLVDSRIYETAFSHSATILMHFYQGGLSHYCSEALLTLPPKAVKSNPGQKFHQDQPVESSGFSLLCWYNFLKPFLLSMLPGNALLALSKRCSHNKYFHLASFPSLWRTWDQEVALQAESLCISNHFGVNEQTTLE